MKKIIITTAAIFIGFTAFSAPVKSTSGFSKYIAKQISIYSSFGNEGFEGTVKVRVNYSATAIESVVLVSGINPKIDSKILEAIKNTPSEMVSQMSDNQAGSIIVPVKLVIENN